jgi:hypothetical protein
VVVVGGSVVVVVGARVVVVVDVVDVVDVVVVLVVEVLVVVVDDVVVEVGLPLKASSYRKFHPPFVCQALGSPQQIPALSR